jgi:hypothetical protein
VIASPRGDRPRRPFPWGRSAFILPSRTAMADRRMRIFFTMAAYFPHSEEGAGRETSGFSFSEIETSPRPNGAFPYLLRVSCFWYRSTRRRQECASFARIVPIDRLRQNRARARHKPRSMGTIFVIPFCRCLTVTCIAPPSPSSHAIRTRPVNSEIVSLSSARGKGPVRENAVAASLSSSQSMVPLRREFHCPL